MRGLIVVKKGELSSGGSHGSFYIVARDLAKVLGLPVMGVNRAVYPFIAKMRPDLVITVGTLNTRILATKVAILTAVAGRVIVYGVAEGMAEALKPVSSLTNLATRTDKLHIIVPSNFTRKELQSLGVKIQAVIPHGVDLKEIDSACQDNHLPSSLEKGVRVLSVYSNLFQYRKSLGLRYLLRSWAALPRNAKKKAVLILKVPKGTRRFVYRLASSLGLNKREYQIVDRWLSRHSLFSLFRSAHLYVHGALADAFGIPIVESMACGTPAVVLDAPPWNEIVDERTGWLVSVEREEILRRQALFLSSHRLRIPDVDKLSETICLAVDFCERTDYSKLRNECLTHARIFDIHKTYEKLKALL